MKYLDLPPDVMARADAMWLDSETTIEELGEKVNCYNVASQAISKAKKYAKLQARIQA